MKKAIAILITILLLFSLSVCYAAEINFTDVKSDDWFYKNLQDLAEKDIASGYPDGTFKPGNTLKFEEFTKLLIIAVDGQVIEQKEGQEWYQIYIDEAIEGKYITEQQKALVGQNISRGTMAEILYNVLTENEEITAYTDAELQYLSDRLTDINIADVKTLTINGSGVISGYPDGTFKPTGTLTRAEAIAVISRVINPELRNPVKIVLRENGIIDANDLEAIPIEETEYERLKNYIHTDLKGNVTYKIDNVIIADPTLFPLKFGNVVITEIGLLKAENSPYYGHTWPVTGNRMNDFDAIVLKAYAINNNSDFNLPEYGTTSIKIFFTGKSGWNFENNWSVKENSTTYEKTKEMFSDYAFGEYPKVSLNKHFTIMFLTEGIDDFEKIIIMDEWDSTNDVLEIDLKDVNEIK